MKNERIGIAKEGYPFIALCAISALVFGLVGITSLALLCLLGLWFSCFFFRDPERVIPTQEHCAVSPADGKVIKLISTQDPYTNEECTLLSIFMNVFNVHVNRSPVKGIVQKIDYFEGIFLNASWDKASTDNERCMYSLRADDTTQWTMVQISGLIARRIVCRIAVGDSLEKGARFGLIRFGSRVDIYIPKEYTPCVAIGDTVHAGESVIARNVTRV